MPTKTILLILLLIMLAGCAEFKRQQWVKSMDDRIGVMTYDEALKTWGQASSISGGAEIFIAEWRREWIEQPSPPPPMPPGGAGYAAPFFAYAQGRYAAGPVERGEELRLVFDSETKKLLGWKFKEW